MNKHPCFLSLLLVDLWRLKMSFPSIKHYALHMCGEMDTYFQEILTSGLDRHQRSTSRSVHPTPGTYRAVTPR